MNVKQPKFLTSNFYNKKTGKLKAGAPASVKKEYNDYQKLLKKNEKMLNW